jgi:hypothetical protein
MVGYEHRDIIRAAIDEFIANASVIRKCRVPSDPRIVATCSLPKHWQDITEHLQAIFLKALPKQSIENSYKFVAAVVPAITGEDPGYLAVKRYLVDPERRSIRSKERQKHLEQIWGDLLQVQP